ncbi:hypothetical protein H8959_003060 [Pygathrix nigripes]
MDFLENWRRQKEPVRGLEQPKPTCLVPQAHQLYRARGFVPVNDSVYAVVRKGLDKNGDSMGLWQRADENCYSNSTLYVKDQYMTVLEAQWQAPKSENITEVEIQAFTVQTRALTILSTLKLTEKGEFLCSPFANLAVNSVSLENYLVSSLEKGVFLPRITQLSIG